MRRIIFSFFAVFLSLSCFSPVWAETKVVSTVDQLMTTVQTAQPGDVIELLDGVYQLTTANGIVVQNKSNLTIRGQSANRDSVIIQGKGINDSSAGFVFKLYNSQYFTLQHITMKNVYWHHIQINDGSSHFVLSDLVMLDAGEAPVKVTSPGGSGPFSDFGLIENCWLGFTDAGTRDVVEGIDIIASAGTVIRNCSFYRVRTNRGPQDVAWGVFAKCNAQDTVIENNYFEDNDIPISFGDGGCPSTYARYGDVTYQHRGGIIRNNIVNRTKDVAVYIQDSNNFKVYNNTLWSTFDGGASSIDVRFNSYGEIVNNISSQGYNLRDGGQAVFAANLWYAGSFLFVDQAGGDFHLSPSANSAIDKGADTTIDVPYDFDNQSRPQGAGVDIGADEVLCEDKDLDTFYSTSGCGSTVDCNDDNPEIFPGAPEICDGIDNDCDQMVDEGCAPICTDADGDNYAVEGGFCGPMDCDDMNPQINPGMIESKGKKCRDGLDNDCDGLIDAADPGCRKR